MKQALKTALKTKREEEKEVTVSVAHAKEISVDAAIEAVFY